MEKRRGKSGSSDRFSTLVLQNHCRWWPQPWNYKTFASWKESYDSLDNILKSKVITLLTKVHIVKAMFFLVVMCGCESWTIKQAEHWRTNAFKLWCWRKFLRVPCTTRRSNQSILWEIKPEAKAPKYFGYLVQRAHSLEKTLMLGKIEGKKRGWQRMRWFYGITDLMDMNLGTLWDMVRNREAWCAVVQWVSKSWTRFSD